MKAYLNLLIACLVLVLGCQKQEAFLDVKRNLSDIRPESLADCQALLDETTRMNTGFPVYSTVGADNLFLTDDVVKSSSAIERNLYLWNKDIFELSTALDFSGPYSKIAQANIVLDLLAKLASSAGTAEYLNIRGQALFHRGLAYYNLSQEFCKPYDATTSSKDPGLQLRSMADPNVVIGRSTVKDAYDFIIKDLTEAITLLPNAQLYVRPSKVAAYGILAKIYLSMREFEKAKANAELALGIYNTLMDFNSSVINPATQFRFPAYTRTGTLNPEIIFYAESNSPGAVFPSAPTSFVDKDLYNSYSDKDLRKTLFYTTSSAGAKFTGTYTGTFYAFSGLGTNELYLIRAECNARSGNVTEAMADLNTLISKRWKKGEVYVPFVASSPSDALNKILIERRKELPFTGQIRWEDLRRLNKETATAITLTKVYNGTTYTLPPNDPRYVLPFPLVEIQLSGIEQNVR